METYYPYSLDNPVSIGGEVHTIKNGQIRLRHTPAEHSITIAGFTESTSPAGLQANQFYCYYARDSLYRDANRILYFSTVRNGATVSVNYKAVGTVFTADDANEIRAHMENANQRAVNFAFALDQQANEILALRNQIATLGGGGEVDLTEHDSSHSAHQFIQGLIQTEESARIIADNNLRTSIQAEQSARAAADSDLQTQIDGKMTFAGTSTTFPANPQAGWLAIVNDAPYLFDGTQWALLKSANDSVFTLGTESSTVEGAMWISI